MPRQGRGQNTFFFRLLVGSNFVFSSPHTPFVPQRGFFNAAVESSYHVSVHLGLSRCGVVLLSSQTHDPTSSFSACVIHEIGTDSVIFYPSDDHRHITQLTQTIAVTPAVNVNKGVQHTEQKRRSMSPLEQTAAPVSSLQAAEKDARIYDYCKACNPDMAEVPHLALPPELHENGKWSEESREAKGGRRLRGG